MRMEEKTLCVCMLSVLSDFPIRSRLNQLEYTYITYHGERVVVHPNTTNINAYHLPEVESVW